MFISTIVTLIVFCYLTLYFSGYYFRVSESLLIGVAAFYFCTHLDLFLKIKELCAQGRGKDSKRS